MLPPFGVMVRNSSITKRSSGVNGLPPASSGLPSIVFLNQARVSGSPVSFASLSMMLYIVLPHWLSATKLWNTSNTTSLWAKYSPSPAFLIQ